jgi:hypothetical protein
LVDLDEPPGAFQAADDAALGGAERAVPGRGFGIMLLFDRDRDRDASAAPTSSTIAWLIRLDFPEPEIPLTVVIASSVGWQVVAKGERARYQASLRLWRG